MSDHFDQKNDEFQRDWFKIIFLLLRQALTITTCPVPPAQDLVRQIIQVGHMPDGTNYKIIHYV
jgi:hypothetical protein